MSELSINNVQKEWFWDVNLNESCLVIDQFNVWSTSAVTVWYPASNKVERVSQERLMPLQNATINQHAFLQYITTAAKINDLLSQNQLLAPITSSVIPLPHQLRVLSKAISDGKYRLLLADEVGLGKTIEAGLIMRELKLRGLVKRVLVVAPKGLVAQWVAEMKIRFNEEFRLILPSEASNRLQSSDGSIWKAFDNVVCPMDSVKPIETRRGWTSEQISDYNRTRYQELISADWDLVIIDEAHRLGGSNDLIARYRLGRSLSESSPYLLLLSATPHQGKTEAFHRLMQLLDDEYFPDVESISRDRIAPYVIRSEKRQAVDADGKQLFKPRNAQLIPIAWESRHSKQRLLYESVSEYVREGYNKAINERKTYLAFLMLLMQRLVTSSTRAIASTLQKRSELLAAPNEQLDLFQELSQEEWNELDGQGQIEELLKFRVSAQKEEVDTIESLLKLAQQCEQLGPDAKSEALLSHLYKLQQEENEPELKVLIFTEFISTQEMLRSFLTDRNFNVVCLNGSMDLEERLEVQRLFAATAQILISTDAGGEGINLQFCHCVVNYDLPWNPMRIEQRIGRVDRIGQTKAVRALNFVLEDTVEFRVREVLEEKLLVILKDLGIDKASDVLDSSLSNTMFDDLYISAVRDPHSIAEKLESIVDEVRKESNASSEIHDLFQVDRTFDINEARNLRNHPLPHWLERMTTAYIEYKGGSIENRKGAKSIVWPDGMRMENVTFLQSESNKNSQVELLSLEHEKIQNILQTIPRFLVGQNLSSVILENLGSDIEGVWSLWKIELSSELWNKSKYLPLFIHRDGRSLNATARAVWDHCVSSKLNVSDQCSNLTRSLFHQHFEEAEKQGKAIYMQLESEFDRYLNHERGKHQYLFGYKLKSANALGLQSVKSHRLNEIAQAQRDWERDFEMFKASIPSLQSIAFIQVKGAY